MSDIRYTARLEDWRRDVTGAPIIWGNIYEDTGNRYRDGTRIHTSRIPDFDKLEFGKGSLVKTLNSIYLLGEPRV